MVVSVVKVGNVGVRVHQLSVFVDVTVPTCRSCGVRVFVVAVIMQVLVGVHCDAMVVFVEVIGTK